MKAEPTDALAAGAPSAVRWITRTLEREGFETWAVGGAVRDVLLGVPAEDWDFATAARPEQVRKVFRRTVPIGVEHGTVGVLARDGTLYEVTTFRRDVETFGRRAVVAFADRIEDDLARRDFTINAIAWHPLRGTLHDPFEGERDLRDRVLRTVGRAAERFAEDWLRVLRALRFAGRFGLEIEAATWRALRSATPHLPGLSPERVREELVKVLEKDAHPARSLDLYRKSGALHVLHPELAALVEADAGDEGAGGLWPRALATAEALPRHRPLLRLAALLLDTGVPVAVPGQPRERDTGDAVAAGGRALAAARAAALTTRLRFSNAQADRVTALVRAGPSLPPADADEAAAVERRRWLSAVGPELVPDLARLAAARARVNGPDRTEVAVRARALRAELRAGPPLTVHDLAIDGRDLIRMGLRPGPAFGRILEALLSRVIERPELNRRDRLEALAGELAGEGG